MSDVFRRSDLPLGVLASWRFIFLASVVFAACKSKTTTSARDDAAISPRDAHIAVDAPLMVDDLGGYPRVAVGSGADVFQVS